MKTVHDLDFQIGLILRSIDCDKHGNFRHYPKAKLYSRFMQIVRFHILI